MTHSITPPRLESFYFLSVLNAVVICEDQSAGDGWMNECSWRKTCPSATLAITKPTWIDLELNWSLCGDRLETLSFFFKFVILKMLSTAQASC